MDFKPPQNTSMSKEIIVDKPLTARTLGSGSVDTLATPMMIALMEAAALDAVQRYLPEGWTTVSTRMDIEHLRGTPAGKIVRASAVLIEQKGTVLKFAVEAADESGVIGQGSLWRAAVDIEQYKATP